MGDGFTELAISIHAPTRGATGRIRGSAGQGYYFNPRSYKRSDRMPLYPDMWTANFNPRSYKRSDNSNETSKSQVENFNPRSYKRSDSVPVLLLLT